MCQKHLSVLCWFWPLMSLPWGPWESLIGPCLVTFRLCAPILSHMCAQLFHVPFLMSFGRSKSTIQTSQEVIFIEKPKEKPHFLKINVLPFWSKNDPLKDPFGDALGTLGRHSGPNMGQKGSKMVPIGAPWAPENNNFTSNRPKKIFKKAWYFPSQIDIWGDVGG